MSARPKPFVSIVMPALNEENYISGAIQSILPRPDDELQYELLVLDGGSVDRTLSIIQKLSASNSRIRLIQNARRTQAAAVNLGAQLADPRSSYLVRADCHSKYPEGFVQRCIQRLDEEKVASVVVSMHARGLSCLQKAIAAAQNSRLGNGGSSHRLKGQSGRVDHGHHAAFDKHVFLELGGYDELFTHNEDAEFDTRLIGSGRAIYLNGEVSVDYFPRSSLGSLSRQYFNFGWGRANTIIKHRSKPKLRQLLPVAAFLGCLLSIAMAAVDFRFIGVSAFYIGSCLLWGLALAMREKERSAVVSGPAAMVMHMSWAVGFLYRLVRIDLMRILHPRCVPRAEMLLPRKE